MDPYRLVRPILFRFEPETAHALTLTALRLAGATGVGRAALRRLVEPRPPSPAVELLGLRFRNRLGLAAGYDKDGRAVRGLACLGFGHIEVGTVTPRPQPGNPRPRLFRLVEDEALVNRLGFPSRGAAAVLRSLEARRPDGVVLGVSLGKGASTPLEAAAEDYASLVETFRAVADYLVLNVSSPNTLGLRRLQGRQYLEDLLGRVRAALERGPGRRPPLLLKLSPDLTPPELEDALSAASGAVEGLVVANTTTSRPGLQSTRAVEAGGLSGRPLYPIVRQQVERVCRWAGGRFVVVACGGVGEPRQVRELLDVGADLVQLYTALVYRGPGIVPALASFG